MRGPVRDESWAPFPQPAGAECVFLGRTRAETHPQNGKLTMLRYEAYEDMARRLLNDLAQEAVTMFGCLAVRIHHAMGDVPVGEASVCVNVVCGHRAKAFEACRFLIDSLKESVPIWKQEVWERGSTWSKGETSPARSHRHEQPGESAQRD